MRKRKHSEWRVVKGDREMRVPVSRRGTDEVVLASPWQTGQWRVDPSKISITAPTARKQKLSRAGFVHENDDDTSRLRAGRFGSQPIQVLTYWLFATCVVLLATILVVAFSY